MGFISNIIGEQNLEGFKMADNNGEDSSSGKQISAADKIKAVGPTVDFADLEMAYKSDAINFNAINKSVQMIMSAGFKNFIHEKKYVVTKFNKFFERIGEIGNDLTFEELFESIFRDSMVYGNAYVEKIFDTSDKRIVDLAMIDPKRIDYAKSSDGKILLDQNGKPIGYLVKLDSGTYSVGDEIPSKYKAQMSREESHVFLLAKRVCHFKLYTIGDGLYGVGLIEPAYKSGIYKKNIEKGQANSIYTRGFSPMIAFVGNERRMATPSDIQGVLDKIKKLNYKQYDAFPDWVKIESVKLNETSMARDALKDMRTDQIAALSAPQALVSGSGEATNRATLSDQRVLWEFTLKDMIQKITSYFKKYILQPIDDYNKIGGAPDIEWGELRAEDVDITADKLIRLLTSKSSNIPEELRDDLVDELSQVMNIKKSANRGKYKYIEEEKAKKENEEIKKENDLIKKTVEVKKEEVSKKDKKEVEKKLSEVNQKIKLLEKEKETIKSSTAEKLELEKQNFAKELEARDKLTEEKLEKLKKENDKKFNDLIEKKEKEMKEELDKLESKNNLADDDINRLIKEKKIEQIKKKEKLIKKLEEDLEDAK